MVANYVIFICLLATVLAYLQPARYTPEQWFGHEAFFENENDQQREAWDRQDQEEAPTHEHHQGRVQIKVYRGPDQQDEHEHFAPYGYWVKQPADDTHR